ncbi:MAG: TldD/PmbA family protein, partial [Candidatus Heimdallarchaeaceae archaeon]
LSNKIVDYALSKNVDAVEVYSQYSLNMQIMTEGLAIANERAKEELGFAIRVIIEESEGFSYTNKNEFTSMKTAVEDAIGIAKVSPENPGIGLPEPSVYPSIEGIYTSQVENLSIEDLIENAKEILQQMGDTKVELKTNLSGVNKEENWFSVVNSLGVEGFEKSNYYTGNFFVVPRKGDKFGSFVFDDFFTHNPKSINHSKFGRELAERAVRNIDAIAPSSIDSDEVIFQNNGIFMPIAIVIAQAVAAHNVLQNRSFWKDKLADQVAIEDFNFLDDSHNQQVGFGVRSFDDEGFPTQQTVIIKDGILENFLFDTLRANKMKAQSTGNSWRGLGNVKFMTPPSTIFPNAPIIGSGDYSFNEMIEETKLGIIFEYFSGSFRVENGIFSGVAKGAQLIEKGELAEPLINVSIAGNIFDLLMNIEGMTKKRDLASAYMLTPKIKAKGINITTQK